MRCSRDDKRYTEKKNKSERARRKKEDTARLRQLVDLTLAHDPRIKRIKQEEKEAREAKKRARTGGAGSGASTPTVNAQEEAKRKAEEAKAKEEADLVRLQRRIFFSMALTDLQAAKADAKKAKAAAANAAKKARRAQRAAEGGAE